MNEKLFFGCGTALITPFRSGKVDFEALERLIERQIDSGCDALIVCGTTGEAATLTDAEKEDILSLAVRQCSGRIPVICGSGCNCTERTIRRSLRAQQLGADALLLITPYYNRCTPQGLIRHFASAADAVDLPIILYNVPSRTSVNLSAETAAQLAQHPNICAVKEASGDLSQAARLMEQCGSKFSLYSGNDDQILPFLSLGAQGVISVLSNLFPQTVHDLCAAYFSGDTDRAREIQLRILPLCRLLFCEVNPIPVKAALHMMGLCENELRLPLTPLHKKYCVELEKELATQY